MNNDSTNNDLNQNNKMTLDDLGYNQTIDNYRKQENLSAFGIGRVILEHKESYVIKTESGEFNGEIIGNLRYTAKSRLDFPAVGDWVAVSEYDVDKVLIHKVLKRSSIIKRKAIGKYGDQQIIATNVDYAFIIQAVNRDFNLNRIERYLTICNDSSVKPIIVISKIDLISEIQTKNILDAIENRIKNVPVIAISNESNLGIDLLKQQISKGKTYCVLGSSGVGKSTLINTLIGKVYLKTGAIGKSTDRGKHITSQRELIVLEDGGIVIDTPGMRELGMSEMSEGLEHTFDDITRLATACKYKNCSHKHEKDCAVLKAVEVGEIHKAAYENYLKLVREKEHFESTMLEKRRKSKQLTKMIRANKKNKK
ncbi:ribosome small subunit-dependent GTPase A [Fulvivirgaceae bacterium BMA10]|uniref:Small ribosomal subunit biogenesis GTPase RsgA n=1 Tax=Splendidivirga corallicola TaxID=3051826 RepID=A0ABT8KN03_9BACT|nr:ribosome small subunit-dependent GTPase A [Fulvivirgaceae bacterium BMA10]